MRQLKPLPRPKLLDLFCGAGGAARGYYAAGWEPIGVDYARQENYPYEFHQLDVMELDIEQLVKWEGFQGIHASPPCQSYSMNMSHLASWERPKLIEPLKARFAGIEIPWVIENVDGAPLDGITLCGTMFCKKLRRHRKFESNYPLTIHHLKCDHEYYGPVYQNVNTNRREIKAWMEEMELDGLMHQREAYQSVPPFYTEYIGLQLSEHIERRVAKSA